MKVCVVSGGFDPLHSGHIAYFKSAKSYGDILIVALNSDDWLIKKKNKFFMPFNERKNIIENLSVVDNVIDFEDDDQGSCINALKKIKSLYPNEDIIFCNGGDRNKQNIPEMIVPDIRFEFAVGGNSKKNSSSWILKEFQFDSEVRIWGKFFNLFEDAGLKVKELIVDAGKGLSFQKHYFRSEIWFVYKGSCIVNYSERGADNYKSITLNKNETIHIKKEAWHQIINENDEPCHIIEIQYGEKTEEDDIERLRYYEKN
tara:strand:- start:114 stop:887 length:774 start_codon:yes stop_codon:yes gene_type:complete